MVLVVQNLSTNAGDVRDAGSIPEWERSSGGGYGNPLQYSCLKNSLERATLPWPPSTFIQQRKVTQHLAVEWVNE